MIPEEALLTKVQVVLIATSHAGNIGSVARAMKTMGFSRLVLVAPKRFPAPEATWMSAGASDVLLQARVVPTLEEAIAKSQWVVATSARTRAIGEAPEELRTGMLKVINLVKEHDKNIEDGALISLVFGTERTGLENHHLDQCQQVVFIPANPIYSSLNLGNAVQVVLYELRQGLLSNHNNVNPDFAHKDLVSAEALASFYDYLEKTLIKSKYLDPQKPRHLMRRIKQLFSRTMLNNSELAMLRGIFVSLSNSDSSL